jgi:hypothetical protein
MIYQRIISKEMELKSVLSEANEKLESIDNIKKLLSKIDDKVEYIALNNYEKVKALLEELKGERLSEVEDEIVKEVIIK